MRTDVQLYCSASTVTSAKWYAYKLPRNRTTTVTMITHLDITARQVLQPAPEH